MYQCKLCFKPFQSQQGLNCHMKVHKPHYEKYKTRYRKARLRGVEIRKKKAKQREIKYLKNPTKCLWCGKIIPYKKARAIPPGKFCNKSHAAKYNNRQRKNDWTKRRSKLEQWLEVRLTKDYPKLNILFNDRETLGLELDIFIPDLKLGIELNGPVHYEPIYGSSLLEKTKNKDQQKLIQCYKKGIELIIIDVSKYTYMKESKNLEYYTVIKNHIILNSNKLLISEKC